jgi:Uncharacterised protein family (UPF0203)
MDHGSSSFLLTTMAHSLDERCTRLKLEYDSCFNSWFEGYLEPAVSASASPESRAKYSKEKAEEYERKCGKIWASYRDCVQVRQIHRSSYNHRSKNTAIFLRKL